MVSIIRSETFLSDISIKEINELLEETIREFIVDDERIINIEMKEDRSGLKRFWIYLEIIA